MPCPTDWGFQFETTEAAGNTDDDEDGGMAMTPSSSPSVLPAVSVVSNWNPQSVGHGISFASPSFFGERPNELDVPLPYGLLVIRIARMPGIPTLPHPSPQPVLHRHKDQWRELPAQTRRPPPLHRPGPHTCLPALCVATPPQTRAPSHSAQASETDEASQGRGGADRAHGVEAAACKGKW